MDEGDKEVGQHAVGPAEAQATPEPLPQGLSEQNRRGLLEALAGQQLFAHLLRNKEATGKVLAIPETAKDLVSAERNFETIKANLAELSADGLPTYALIHYMRGGVFLESWLIAPDGAVVRGEFSEIYEGLDAMSDGLGVNRLASTRAALPEGTPPPSDEEVRAARARDRSPQAIRQRGATLARTASMLLPGAVGEALGTRHGRVLLVAARDTGTAPYAALPLKNGVAAQHWSFVVVPDVETLAGYDLAFDFRALDIDKAVIVGDPDLTSDPRFDWVPLPGARREAIEVASDLGEKTNRVLLGKDATRANLVGAINSNPGLGMVYLATHAVSDADNPLTQGFIAMSGGHYFAGHIRQERFPGWKTHHPLVVISACQTALGRLFDGGSFGVARTWTVAGAGQVVASLWNVSDNATMILMTSFVERLKAGDAPEIAMQKAQLATMDFKDAKGNQPYLDDPKMWASFTVYGRPARLAKRQGPA
jgi:hypothetical protein